MLDLALSLLLSASAPAVLPFDSIANPLLKAPPGTDIQREGDLANLSPSRVRVNQAGYRLMDVRKGMARFLVVGGSATSALVSGGGASRTVALVPKAVRVSGQVNPYASNSALQVVDGIGDWRTGYPMTGTKVSGLLSEGTLPTDLLPGRYQVTVGGDVSSSFVVSPNVYGMVRDASLMFFGIQRSGDGQSWFHPASHTWDGWLFDTTGAVVDKDHYKGALAGGWYDCGDHLKETRTQSFALAMLGATAATMPGLDKDHFDFDQSAATTDGIPDVLRELKWSADYALKAFRLAGGKVEKKKLFLSVGDFGKDHGWWGRPEDQDSVGEKGRGGRRERAVRDDWGTPSLSDWAAGLAFAAKLWKPYDQAGWCDSALTAAEAFYAGAKSFNALESSSAYIGESKSNDDLAMAAVALLWATGEKTYLNELAYTPSMPDGKGGVCGATRAAMFPASSFAGGFMGCGPDNMRKSSANTGWSSMQAPALYAFHKLILKDSVTAKAYGLNDAERSALEEKVICNTVENLGSLGVGSGQRVPLPGTYAALVADSVWGTMYTQQDWVWNRYQAGNLLELALYLDMVGDVVATETVLPNTPSPDWKRDSVLSVLLRGTNYLLGMNALDISWLLGVGSKNPNHPFHRASNPEGRNSQGAYSYRIPVGALYGGVDPRGDSSVLDDQWYRYQRSEMCLDGAAVTTMLMTSLANDTSTVPGTAVGLRTASLAGRGMGLRLSNAGTQLRLVRSAALPVDVELLDVRGTLLSRQTWNGTTLELPRSRSLRWARVGGVEILPIAPF